MVSLVSTHGHFFITLKFLHTLVLTQDRKHMVSVQYFHSPQQNSYLGTYILTWTLWYLLQNMISESQEPTTYYNVIVVHILKACHTRPKLYIKLCICVHIAIVYVLYCREGGKGYTSVKP